MTTIEAAKAKRRRRESDVKPGGNVNECYACGCRRNAQAGRIAGVGQQAELAAGPCAVNSVAAGRVTERRSVLANDGTHLG